MTKATKTEKTATKTATKTAKAKKATAKPDKPVKAVEAAVLSAETAASPATTIGEIGQFYIFRNISASARMPIYGCLTAYDDDADTIDVCEWIRGKAQSESTQFHLDRDNMSLTPITRYQCYELSLMASENHIG